MNAKHRSPMTLGDMRSLGVQRLLVSCLEPSTRPAAMSTSTM